MKTMTAKLPHGWFGGYMKETDIIDTIESSIGRWDIVIVETNKITEREREFLSRTGPEKAISWQVMVIRSIFQREWFITEGRCNMVYATQ